MILTGDDIDAATALRLGLVHKVVARERLYNEAEAWARELMTRSPAVLRYAKEAVTRGLEVSLEEGLAMERRLGRLLTASGV
jgi:enoyl-CoA hydratase/carnithine racemase